MNKRRLLITQPQATVGQNTELGPRLEVMKCACGCQLGSPSGCFCNGPGTQRRALNLTAVSPSVGAKIIAARKKHQDRPVCVAYHSLVDAEPCRLVKPAAPRQVAPRRRRLAVYTGRPIRMVVVSPAADVSTSGRRDAESLHATTVPERAAARLAMGRDRVVVMASDSGFSSHEAFTRVHPSVWLKSRALPRRGGVRGDGRGARTSRRDHASVRPLADALPPIARRLEPECRHVHACHRTHGSAAAASPHRKTPRDQMSRPRLLSGLGKTDPYAPQEGLVIAGRPFVRYSDVGPGLLTMETGTPLAAPAPDVGEIEVKLSRCLEARRGRGAHGAVRQAAGDLRGDRAMDAEAEREARRLAVGVVHHRPGRESQPRQLAHGRGLADGRIASTVGARAMSCGTSSSPARPIRQIPSTKPLQCCPVGQDVSLRGFTLYGAANTALLPPFVLT